MEYEFIKRFFFFEQKEDLLTATWYKPFSYSSIKSNHAPLGPYMGNGDVGVVTYYTLSGHFCAMGKLTFCMI